MFSPNLLGDPGLIPDPYPVYAGLVESEPVHWSGSLRAWCVMSYSGCLSVLKDCRLKAQRMDDILKLKFPDAALDQNSIYHRFTQNVMMYVDEPLHGVLRRSTRGAFSREAHEFYRGAIDAVTSELVAAIPNGCREIEAVEALTSRLPVRAAVRAFGVPEEDLPFVLPRVQVIMTYWSGPQSQPIALSDLLACLSELHSYGLELAQGERGRVEPGTAIARLLAVDFEEAGITVDQAVHQLVLLLIALFAPTTPGSASSGLLAFISHPDQIDRFRGNASCARNAADEVFRYNSSNQFTWRVATTDMEIAGVPITRGDAVVPFLASANRDPEMFPNPNRFDLSRTNSAQHLSFGSGVHSCLGRQIAAMEIHSFFAALFRRFNRVRPAGDPVWNPNLEFRSLASLPVRLG